MRSIFIAVIMSATIVFTAYADSISQRWDKTYGYGQSWATSVQQTMDGGYVVAGYTVFDNVDFYLLKLDCNGAVVWQKVYGGSSGEAALSVEQTFDGGYIVAGWTLSFGEGGISTLVLKLDNDGNIIWQRVYGGYAQVANTSVKQTVDGGYIMISGTNSFGEGIIVAKLNPDGDITWQKFYGYFAMQTFSEYKYPIFQTSDGGYIFATNEQPDGFAVVKLHVDGNIVWQKTYGGGRLDAATAIEETSDGGYVVSGVTFSFGAGEDDFWILQLTHTGDIAWQKTYGGANYDYATSIKQTAEGGYIVVGGASSFGDPSDYLWILKLDSIGDITWQKVYLERESGMWPTIEKTSDGGYIVSSSSSNPPVNAWFIWLLKMDINGEIPGCDVLTATDAIPSDTYATVRGGTATAATVNLSVTHTDIVPHSAYQSVAEICQYDDPADVDGDGVENNPAVENTPINNNALLLANEDNCLTIPNGPFLGTCSKGTVGASCIAHAACGIDGFCSMNQEDSYPPQGNGIGDVCECEGDFDCDSDTDGTDASIFKADFGRSTFNSPCIAGDTCNGDFSCDGDVDGTDAALFKSDFGRSSFSNPCPVCTAGGEWCQYQ